MSPTKRLKSAARERSEGERLLARPAWWLLGVLGLAACGGADDDLPAEELTGSEHALESHAASKPKQDAGMIDAGPVRDGGAVPAPDGGGAPTAQAVGLWRFDDCVNSSTGW
jgi:hypothetical protein